MYWFALTDVSVFVYFLGNILFYVLLLKRISKPFDLKPRWLLPLSCLIVLFAMVSMVYFFEDIIWVYLYSTGSLTMERDELDTKIISISSGIMSGIDLLLNTSILTIFIKKMRQTVNAFDEGMSSRLERSLKVERNINALSNVTTRHALLFSIALFTNQCFFIHQFIGYYYASVDDNAYTGYSLRTVECFGNILVIWLLLRINYTAYICLCKRCHICVAKCCYKKVQATKRSLLIHTLNCQAQNCREITLVLVFVVC